jgi:hypothetical protein
MKDIEKKGWLPIEICDMAMMAMKKESDVAIQEQAERIKRLEEAGNRLALLMTNGTMSEIRQALWSWRELNPKKKDDSNDQN